MRRLIVIVAVALCFLSCTRYLQEDGGRRSAAYRSYTAPTGVGVIGLSLGQRSLGGDELVLVVDRTVPEGPAALADIRPGDGILEVDGESTRGMTIGEAARLIRGPADSAIELRIDSPRGSRLITLVRVPPASLWGERPAPCVGCPHRAARPQPSDTIETKPEPWPPSKPGHPYP
jgi:hypothetical protein